MYSSFTFFIDNYISKSASSYSLIYLYALRFQEDGLPIPSQHEIATALRLPLSDVSDAWRFWASEGLATVSNDHVTLTLPCGGEEVHDGAYATSKSENMTATATFEPPRVLKVLSGWSTQREKEGSAETTMVGAVITGEVPLEEISTGKSMGEAPAKVKPEKKKETEAEQVVSRLDGNPELARLYEHAGAVFARPMTNTEIKTLYSIHDDLKLPSGVIHLLLNYAQQIGKVSAKYIEKVAINWHSKGIDDVLKAEALLCEIEKPKAKRAKKTATTFSNFTPRGDSYSFLEEEYFKGQQSEEVVENDG